MLHENQQLKRDIQYLTSEVYVPISNTIVSYVVDPALNFIAHSRFPTQKSRDFVLAVIDGNDYPVS